MAFVLVQHLDPKRESMLKEILSRSTSMPVHEVETAMPVQPNRVYVIPSNAEISLVDGTFEVAPRPPLRGREMSIDHFLGSLAEQYKSRAIGVVLSGSLSDGALGLRAVKAEGGLTFAQDEGSARFHDMPRAAIATGSVDFILPPEKIARELARIGKHLYLRPASAFLASEPLIEGGDHQRILSMLRKATGADFAHYRQTTVRRRILRRMALRKADSLKNYLDLLRQEPGEVHALYEDILITVTRFFRDPEAFQALKSAAFPTLLKERSANTPLRIWVPGCSTGEEVYSIAIALFESLQDTDTNPPIQIFATDVSETAIDKARSGVYLENSMADVPPERLKRFFSKTDGAWQISKTIRDVCIFARQNITTDPPFSNLDLISCRNVLIYLEPILQKRVIPLFHYALKPNGFLMLGSAETISGFEELFLALDRGNRIFLKRPGSLRPAVDFARLGRRAPHEEASAAVSPEIVTPLDLQKEADRLVVGRYGPAGVLINDNFDVIQFRGRTSPYLEAAPGAASFNILKMAREGLLVELRASILRAKKTGRPVRKEGLQIREDGDFREVDLEVIPMKDGSGSYCFLILFEEAGKKARGEKPPISPEKRVARGQAEHLTIVKLEQELTATKEYLQSIIEEQEASNEELKSANEEILSANEELQSTNEELETAKEELQSTNEELTTVNDELQNRSAEVTRVNNDLVNLLTGTSLAIVMLGSDGRLRRFTPQAEKLLNLIPTDVGRPIRDIKPKIRAVDLDQVSMEVIETVSSREREVQDEDGNWYQMRVRPYRTLDNRIDGAVLAFYDIDPLKRSIELVHRARDYAEALVETVREALIVLDDRLRVRSANHGFYRTFETSPKQAEGKSLFELWGWSSQDPALRELVERVAQNPEPLSDREAELEIPGLGKKTLLFNARRVRLPGETETRILLAIDDITQRKVAEKEMRDSEARYRRIFETAREGIWLLDADTGEILDVNPYLLGLLGYSLEELLGEKPWSLGLYENPEEAQRLFAEVRKSGFSFEQGLPLRTKTGETVYVDSIRNVYKLDHRHVIQSNMRDVTESTRLQEQLRQMQKLDSIGTLAGGVAHDFNNLLNIISAHLALIARDQPAARGESIEAIQKAIDRGSAVVRQLLTFARKSETSFESTDVNDVVREVSSMIQETFPKEIEIVDRLQEDLPPIRADANQLHQALLNLAVNARDAMAQGGRLTFRTDLVGGASVQERFPDASAKQYVEVLIEDTGDGMDPDTRQRVFEPFFTTKKEMGGQGLGLAVVYGIVNGHRGMIDLESDPGRGTTFRLYFAAEREDRPAAPRRPGEGEGKLARAADSAATARETPARALLLVEDEELLLGPMKSLLEDQGFEVLTARDGLEAVAMHAANAGRISAVIVDLGLPLLGGWEAFLRMRERDPALKCVIASGNIDSKKREEIRGKGARSIRKPYSGEELLEAVRASLGPSDAGPAAN